MPDPKYQVFSHKRPHILGCVLPVRVVWGVLNMSPEGLFPTRQLISSDISGWCA